MIAPKKVRCAIDLMCSNLTCHPVLWALLSLNVLRCHQQCLYLIHSVVPAEEAGD